MSDGGAPPRRRMSASARRDALLDSAAEVFARSGYNGASLEEIASSAGVSKALIYEHFDSKRELHIELVNRQAAEVFGRLEEAAESGTTGEERLRLGVDAFLSFVEENRDAWRATFRDATDAETAEALAGVQAQAVAVIAGLMAGDPDRRARKNGRAESQALFMELHAQLLAGAVQAVANWWYDHPEVPRAAVTDRVMEFCWIGLERVSDGVVVSSAAREQSP